MPLYLESIYNPGVLDKDFCERLRAPKTYLITDAVTASAPANSIVSFREATTAGTNSNHRRTSSGGSGRQEVRARLRLLREEALLCYAREERILTMPGSGP